MTNTHRTITREQATAFNNLVMSENAVLGAELAGKDSAQAQSIVAALLALLSDSDREIYSEYRKLAGFGS